MRIKGVKTQLDVTDLMSPSVEPIVMCSYTVPTNEVEHVSSNWHDTRWTIVGSICLNCGNSHLIVTPVFVNVDSEPLTYVHYVDFLASKMVH